MEDAIWKQYVLQAIGNTSLEQSHNPCAAGYTGAKCASCITGYYRLNSECAKCPNTAYLLILGYAGGMALILALVVYANVKKIDTSALSIGTDFLQARGPGSAFGSGNQRMTAHFRCWKDPSHDCTSFPDPLVSAAREQPRCVSVLLCRCCPSLAPSGFNGPRPFRVSLLCRRRRQ